MKYIIGLLFILIFQLNSNAQLKGKIFGIENGMSKPLQKVKINIQQTTVYSSENGEFEIVLPKNLPDTLFISYPGFTTEKVVVTKDDRYIGLEIYLFKENELEEVIIEFKRDSKGVNRLSPHLLENLGEDEFRKAACCNLSESFETNATVDVNITDAVSGAKKIQLLGLDGIYTQFQFENIPFLTGLESSFGMNSIPGTWVESIQITKGTGSVVNGYESMAGLINIEMRKPTTTHRLFVNSYFNSFGRTEINLHGGQIINDKWSTASFAHGSTLPFEIDQNKDQFRDLPLFNSAAFMNRWQYDGKRFETRFGVLAYADDRIGGQLSTSDSTVKYKANNSNRHIEAFAKTGFIFKKQGHSLGIIYQFKHHEQFGVFGLNPNSGKENRGYVNLIYDGIIKKTIYKYRLGVNGIAQDLEQNFGMITSKRNLRTVGFFGEFTYSGMRSVIVIGARYDLVDKFKHIFSPRLHYKYKVTEKTDFRFTIGKAWRLPTIFQDNVSLMATGRTWFIPTNDEQEIMWNGGVSVSNSFKLWNRAASWTTDFYQTFFTNQLVIDRDADVNSIFFSYQKNTGTTSVFQTELSIMPLKVLTLRFAYKYLSVRARYNGIIQQQAMQPKNRILVNVAYQSRNKKWDFDATVSMISPMRMYGGHLGNESQHMEYSPWVPMGLTQITYSLKRINFYVGAENLFNIKQQNPIIDVENPFSTNFDATRIYAPITGVIVYTGLRLELTRKKVEK